MDGGSIRGDHSIDDIAVAVIVAAVLPHGVVGICCGYPLEATINSGPPEVEPCCDARQDRHSKLCRVAVTVGLLVHYRCVSDPREYMPAHISTMRSLPVKLSFPWLGRGVPFPICVCSHRLHHYYFSL